MAAKVPSAYRVEALVLAIPLFAAAGTLRWLAGLAFVALFFGAAVLITRSLAQRNALLPDEPINLLPRKTQPLCDRIILSVFHIFIAGWLVVVGFDAVRFGWSAVPVWLQWIGGAGSQ